MMRASSIFAQASIKPEPQMPIAGASPITLQATSSPIAHLLDGSQRPAHAVPDLRALERRAGRRRAGEELFPRAHHDFAVGADVDERADLLAFVDARREHARHRVGADEAGHDRQQAHLGVGRGLERQLARRIHEQVAHRRRVGREPHVGHVDPEEDVVHAGVADHDDLVDVLRRDTPALRARLLDEVVDGRRGSCARSVTSFASSNCA